MQARKSELRKTSHIIFSEYSYTQAKNATIANNPAATANTGLCAAPVNVPTGEFPVGVTLPPVVLDGTNVLAPVCPTTGVLTGGAGVGAAAVSVNGSAGTSPTPPDVGPALPPVTGTCCVIVLNETCGTVTVCVRVVVDCVRVNVMTVEGKFAGGGVGAGGLALPPVTGADGVGAGGCGTRVTVGGMPVQIPGFSGTNSAQRPTRKE